MEERKQFTFYLSIFKAIRKIKKKTDRADAYDAICAYALFGEEPELEAMTDSVSIAYEAWEKANGCPAEADGEAGAGQPRVAGGEGHAAKYGAGSQVQRPHQKGASEGGDSVCRTES